MNRVALVCSSLLLATSAACVFAKDTTVDSADQLKTTIRDAQPGDVILLKDGTYNDADIKFYASGAEDKPITLRAQTPGEVVLTGQSRLHIAGKYLVVDGLSFRDGYVTSDHVIVFRGDEENGATHCRL